MGPMCIPHTGSPANVRRPPLGVRGGLPRLDWDMCGIVGLFSKSQGVSDALGRHLSEMLLQLSDRGPDSAGVAFYREPAPAGSCKVSLFGPDGYGWNELRDALAEEL